MICSAMVSGHTLWVKKRSQEPFSLKPASKDLRDQTPLFLASSLPRWRDAEQSYDQLDRTA